jgi:hypothetical protein
MRLPANIPPDPGPSPSSSASGKPTRAGSSNAMAARVIAGAAKVGGTDNPLIAPARPRHQHRGSAQARRHSSIDQHGRAQRPGARQARRAGSAHGRPVQAQGGQGRHHSRYRAFEHRALDEQDPAGHKRPATRGIQEIRAGAANGISLDAAADPFAYAYIAVASCAHISAYCVSVAAIAGVF